MKIIESFIVAKSQNINECEDAIFYNENFACVIDGATSKGSNLWGGKTSGQKAAELIKEEIKGFPNDINPTSAINQINKRIMQYYISKGQLETVTRSPKERLTASMVLYSVSRNEIWQIGDCIFMIDGVLHLNNKKIDEILSEVMGLVLELSLIEGMSMEQISTEDLGRNFILPLLQKQSFLQNHPNSRYAYTVIDGFDVDINKVVIKPVPKGTKQIILASDGYPELKPTLEESEQALQNIIKQDPLCMNRFKSTKGLKPGNQSFDDRAYLRMEL
jgi:hypothetical protein